MGERKNEKSNWPVFPVDASGDGFLPAIHRHFPQGGEKWLSGSQHNITWTFSNIPGSTLVKLLLFRNGAKVGTIAENIPIGSNGAGTYVWPAGSYVGGAADAGDGYQVCIWDVNNQFPFAMSPGTFSITKFYPSFAKMAVQTKPHTIHSSGTVTIRFNRYCDLDSGYEISTVPGCDFWWSQNSIPPHQRILTPPRARSSRRSALRLL